MEIAFLLYLFAIGRLFLLLAAIPQSTGTPEGKQPDTYAKTQRRRQIDGPATPVSPDCAAELWP